MDAEELAAKRLEGAGWQLIERNARTRYGEIDLIATERDRLVFIEVKAGRAGSLAGPERPALAVDRRKQLRIRRLATAWLAEGPPPPRHRELRFDVIGITYDRAGAVVDYEHIRGAF